MQNDLREQHMIAFAQLSPAERLQWSLSTAWKTFNALPEKKQQIYLKMRNNGKQNRQT